MPGSFGTQKVTFQTSFAAAKSTAIGVGRVCLIGKRDAGATVAAGVVKRYRTSSTVGIDQGVGSLLHTAAKLALQNINLFYAVSYADAAVVATLNQRTFGTATVGNNSGAAGAAPTGFDPLLPADMPIYEATTVSIDGTAVDRILYTTGDPTVATLDDSGDGEVLINPYTGAWKVSRDTTGAGAGVVFTYKSADLESIGGVFDQILQNDIEVVTLAGLRYNEQHYGIYRALVEWADENDIMVYAGTDDFVLPGDTDFQTLITAIRQDNFQTLATILTVTTEDVSTAYACQQAKSPVNGTLKDQRAPNGLSYRIDRVYTRAEFGDDRNPNTGTFHYIGVNCATSEDSGQTFIHSSDRCMDAYTATIKFGGVRRTSNATNRLVMSKVANTLAAGTTPPTALFDVPGLKAVESSFYAGLSEAAAADKRWIDPDFALRFPLIGDTEAGDRAERGLEDIEMDYRVLNPIQTVDATVEVSQ